MLLVVLLTQSGDLFGPEAGVPVELDLERSPGLGVDQRLQELLHLKSDLKNHSYRISLNKGHQNETHTQLTHFTS